MEPPSANDIQTIHKPADRPAASAAQSISKPDFALKIHKNELNRHLRDLADGKDISQIADEPARHDVDYTFGDSGSRWRMTKLKGVLRQAEESGRSVEEIATERFGDLQAFDDAREEQLELERRDTYGKAYVGKERPSGELYEQRKRQMDLVQGQRNDQAESQESCDTRGERLDTQAPPATTKAWDPTALNRLKARMMKARLKGSSDLTALEAEYDLALAASSSREEAEVVVLGAMENRMLVGGRHGEVKAIDNKRGRERGLVEENEDMTIEDMVREERRSKGRAGGEASRFAERIAKDAKFDDSLDYMDENAGKLAKRVHQSEINLRNMAIGDLQKVNRILDSCPLCHHEDRDEPPLAPQVSLGTRVYLTLPTEPEISEGGACIVPIQHRGNLLECDDDEWEEIRVGAEAHGRRGC